MMKSPTDWMPAVRHRRSQNAGVVYALVDEVTAVVDALMRISSRTECEFGSRAAKFFGNGLVRLCLVDYWSEMIRPGPERVNGRGWKRTWDMEDMEEDTLGKGRPIATKPGGIAPPMPPGWSPMV